jgi:hypothetical protein
MPCRANSERKRERAKQKEWNVRAVPMMSRSYRDWKKFTISTLNI